MVKWLVETVEEGKIVKVGTVVSPYYKGSKGASDKAFKKYTEQLKGKPVIVIIIPESL